jgi:hypothetical protein
MSDGTTALLARFVSVSSAPINNSSTYVTRYLHNDSSSEGKELSLCLTNQAIRHEGVWGSGCIDLRFLDLGIRWK